MKPTQMQLNDPKWWGDNVKPEYDYAFTTGPDWDGHDECIGTVEFAKEDGSLSSNTGLALDNDCWVLLAERPTKPAFVPEVGEDSLLPEVGSKVGIYLSSLGNVLIPHIVKGYKVWRSIDKNNDHHRVFILLGPSEDKRSGTNERLLNDVRPIKSEREKFIELVGSKKLLDDMSINDLAGALYDAGCRFMEPTK